MDENAKPAAVDHPRGIHKGSIDAGGRLKLPTDFQKYLIGIEEKKVFCTSFDERICRLYPISKWKEIEAMLKEPGDDAEAAEDVWFLAMALGGDSEMDGQGRLPIPAALRKALNLTDKPVYVEHYKQHIKVYSEEVYQERMRRALENKAAKLKTFEKKGLQ